jgi:hypothetical protein
MPRVTPFMIGRRWRVIERPEHRGRYDYPFEFVIIGPGHNATHKDCRLEVIGHGPEPCRHACHHGMTGEYSHNHLRKHATLVPV